MPFSFYSFPHDIQVYFFKKKSGEGFEGGESKKKNLPTRALESEHTGTPGCHLKNEVDRGLGNTPPPPPLIQ